MVKEFYNAVKMLLFMTVVLGLIYPLAMTGVAQIVFPWQANGSMVEHNGRSIGSKWIGQNFEGDVYFQGRPSNAGSGYDGTASSGSNLGPTSEKLMRSIDERAKQVREVNGLPANAKVPSDLVTASGSGLDPHITPAAAQIQIARVAAARGLNAEQVQNEVQNNTDEPQAGFLGDERVNVLMLNLALDRLQNL